MSRVVIIDYHKGNLMSVEHALLDAGANVLISDKPEAILTADALVLPGVGSFADAMAYLQKSGQAAAIREKIQAGTPILGICLGMQLFFTYGAEGATPGEWISGLDLLPGKCVHLPQMDLKIPHVGWNEVQLSPVSENPFAAQLFKNIADKSHFYFTHSYFADPEDGGIIAADTEYGITFTCAVAVNNIYGCQFHPEKSSRSGRQIMQNFLHIVENTF